MLLRLTVVLIALMAANPSSADDKRFVLATTTSTENSGLLDVLTHHFYEATGVTVDVVAVGTGQALALGKRGDAAALLTHDRQGELAFVENGYGSDRRLAMYNDFVLVGPANDPAQIAETEDVKRALQRIAQSKTTFVSRGDDSGTHRKELRLWREAGLARARFGNWYRETGAGMGQTLLTSTEMSAYTLTDRGTWISFARKGNFTVLVQEEPPLLNPYASILVVHPALSDEEKQSARQWHDWLTSQHGRNSINAFKLEGQQLFFAPAP